jgi:O-antigen ligase
MVFWLCALLATAAFGYAAAYSTLGVLGAVATLVIAVPFGIWYLRDHRVGLTVAILSIIPGNLVRLSLGTDVRGGAAIMISDIVIPILVAVWIFRKLVYEKKFVRTPVNAPLVVFTLVALISFIQGIAILGMLGTNNFKDIVISFLYWGRWVEYAMLFFITVDLVKTARDVDFFLRVLFFTATIIAIGGFFQLIYYPDFTQYALLYGWDPHQDRLLSSFFDPNFVGGFLALILSAALGVYFYTREKGKKALYILLMLVLGVALILTYSRSGYLAMVVAGAIICFLRSRLSIVIGIAAIIATFILVPRTLTRITEGLSVDETGVKRIESWAKAVSIVPEYPLLGTGYNTFGFVQDALGTADEFDVNNRSGVENSFLTVLVTTGIVGFVSFAYLYFVILRSLYRNWKSKALPDRWRGLNLGVFAGIVGLLFHAIFIHSLMYPFILVFFWVLIGLALKSAIIKTGET